MASRFTKDPGRSRPYWLLITATPLIPAFLTALRSYLESRVGRGSADWGEVTFAFIDWLFLGALAPIIYVLARRYPVSRKRFGRAFLMHVMGALALCMVWALFGVLLGRLLHRFPGQGNLLLGYASWMLITIPWSMFIYLLFLGCVYAFMYYREAREREAQAARSEAETAKNTAQASQSQLANARQELQDLQAKQTQRGMVVTLSDVLFDTGRATLKPGADRALDRLAQYLKDNPNVRVLIEGHTDSRGSSAYNEELSQRRAQAVAEALSERGVPGDRYVAKGLGKEYPVASNSTAAGQQQNRRVEIVLSDESGRFAQGPQDQNSLRR